MFRWLFYIQLNGVFKGTIEYLKKNPDGKKKYKSRTEMTYSEKMMMRIKKMMCIPKEKKRLNNKYLNHYKDGYVYGETMSYVSRIIFDILSYFYKDGVIKSESELWNKMSKVPFPKEVMPLRVEEFEDKYNIKVSNVIEIINFVVTNNFIFLGSTKIYEEEEKLFVEFDYTKMKGKKYRKGYEELGHACVFEVKKEGDFCLYSLDGKEIKEVDEYDIRLFFCTYFTYQTMITHALYIHVYMSNNTLYNLEKSCKKDGLIMRILRPLYQGNYEINEDASNHLIDEKGLNLSINISYEGMINLFDEVLNEMDFEAPFMLCDFDNIFGNISETSKEKMLENDLIYDLYEYWNHFQKVSEKIIDNLSESDKNDIEKFTEDNPNGGLKYFRRLLPHLFMLPILHEPYSNKFVWDICLNPFIIQTHMLKQKRLRDKKHQVVASEIGALYILMIGGATGLGVVIDKSNTIATANNLYKTEDEKKLFEMATIGVRKLNIQENSLIHWSKVESSVRW